MDTTVRMAIYRGRTLVDFYDVPLDDEVEKHVRWFMGAVTDEGGNRVRITHRDEDDRVLASWESKLDEFYDEYMENVIEALIEERFMWGVENSGES